MKNKNLVAVYGTLKKDRHNHWIMETAKFIKKSHTGPGFSLFVENLPFLIKRDDGSGCEIEIYEVNDLLLEKLDQLEGHPFFYTRIILREENNLPIFIYVLSDKNSIPFRKMSLSLTKESF